MKQNINITSQYETLKEIAKYNAISAKNIYKVIKNLGTKPPLPTDLPVGIAHRQLTSINIDKMLNSNIMNMWIENGGNFRWGIEVDIYSIKEKMRKFMHGCKSKEKDILSYF